MKILGRGTDPKTGSPIAGFAADMQVKLSDLGVENDTQAQVEQKSLEKL